jgi:hypothetical protein
MSRRGLERRDDPLERGCLRWRELLGPRLSRDVGRLRTPLRSRAASPCGRRDERERAGRRRPVEVGEPERQVDERGRDPAEDAVDRDGLDVLGSVFLEADDDASPMGAPEWD